MNKKQKPSPRSQSSFKPALASFAAYWVLRMLGVTLRITIEDATGHFQHDERPVTIYAIWHNRIGVITVANNRCFRHRRLATLVSMSEDGEILARTVQRFGLHPVRGSTSRRGPQSLLEMVRVVGEGFSAVITPD